MPLLIYDTIEPTGGNFPAVKAKHVDVNGETLLNFIPIILTQSEYNTLLSGGTIILNGNELAFEEHRIYMIKKDDNTLVEVDEAEKGA